MAIAFVVALAPAAAQSPSDVLLDDVGPGWETTECRVPPPAGGATVCFAGTPAGRFLQITATPVPTGTDPRGFADQLASAYAGTPTFPTPGLDGAQGFTLSIGGTDAYTLVVAGPHDVFNIGLIPYEPPSTAVAFLLDIGRRQQERGGGAPPASAPVDPQEGDALERLLVTLPQSSGFVETDTSTRRENYDDLRAQARNQRVIDLLNEQPVATRIFRSGDAVLVVSVAKQPYDEFAAAELGAIRSAGSLVGVRSEPAVADGVAFEMGSTDQQAAAFRRGPYFAMVVLAAPGANPADVGRVVAQVAALQAALLPPGPTDPYSFPSLAESLVLALVLTTLVCLAVVGVGRFRARRRRRAVDGSPGLADPTRPAPGDAVDVGVRATVLRRRGYVVLAVQIAAVDAVVVGVLVVIGAIDLPSRVGVVVAAIGVAGALAVTRVAARRELAAFGGAGHVRRGRWRSPLGAAAGIVALALLVAGLTLAASGLADLVFGPSIGGLERAAALQIAPSTLRAITLIAGLALLVVGGVGVRLARMWSRATATRLRQLDQRPPILYLRSFHDDALPLPSVLSARRPFLELFVPRGADPFEEAVAWELAPYGPVVAVGRPGRSLASLGAARDHLADDEWQAGVTERMAAARAIVIAIGSTRGLHWEIGALVGHGHLAKTIFLFPPTDVATHQERWRATVRALRDAGTLVPPLPGDPDRALTTVLDRRGQWHVAAAARRDEATYRVAVDVAMAALAASTDARPRPRREVSAGGGPGGGTGGTVGDR